MNSKLRSLLIFVLLGVEIITFAAILISSHLKIETVLRDHAQEVMAHLTTAAADNSKQFLAPAERGVELTETLIT
jgi:hypothetical protein